MKYIILQFFIGLFVFGETMSTAIPLVINTWKFTNATQKAWEVVYKEGRSALDAVELGCTVCEVEQCDGTVGYGGSPDEDGETTLDAMIMDGPTHNVGSVGALRRVKSAISVARRVMEYTKHTLLVGDQATKFAIQMGFKEEDLSTNVSKKMWEEWKANSCQPNFWQDVKPDPLHHCGPYHPLANTSGLNPVQRNLPSRTSNELRPEFGPGNHDTVGMVVIDTQGRIAAGTSTNGAKYKIPGRVGDSPLVGAGAYVDQDVGGASGTGDGDILMRFLPSYQAVENMRQGMDPTAAAADAIKRITKKYSNFVGALVATTIDGRFGAACHGIPQFPFSVCNPELGKVTVHTVTCLN